MESFLSQPLLAGLPPPASPLRTWPGSGSGSTYHPRPSSWSTCACSSPWATCSATGWYSPHRDPQPHRHRRSGALPADHARPVRPAGRPVQRVSQRVPVPRPRSGPHHPPRGWWPGQHRQPATTANSLQPGQTRLASGVPKPIPRWDVHFEGLEDYRKDPNTTGADQ